MVNLIVVRHGAYFDDNTDGGLNGYGKDQIESLAKKLKIIVGQQSVMILSSTAARATQSAEIISKQLKVAYEKNEILWSDNNHRESCEKTFDLIKPYMEKVDVIILVTHYEYAEDFPRYFADHYLSGRQFSERCHSIRKGDAWSLDCRHQNDVIKLRLITSE